MPNTFTQYVYVKNESHTLIASNVYGISAEFRYPVYTCTVADYFCQGVQLKKFGHVYRAPAFKNAISVLMLGTRLFSA